MNSIYVLFTCVVCAVCVCVCVCSQLQLFFSVLFLLYSFCSINYTIQQYPSFLCSCVLLQFVRFVGKTYYHEQRFTTTGTFAFTVPSIVLIICGGIQLYWCLYKYLYFCISNVMPIHHNLFFFRSSSILSAKIKSNIVWLFLYEYLYICILLYRTILNYEMQLSMIWIFLLYIIPTTRRGRSTHTVGTFPFFSCCCCAVVLQYKQYRMYRRCDVL